MNTSVRILTAGLIIGLPFLACCSPGSDLPPLPPTPTTSSYHLGPGDRLGIRVLGADELAGEYTVQDDGTIRVLMIGEVPAAGATSGELETRIAQKLKTGRYINDPQGECVGGFLPAVLYTGRGLKTRWLSLRQWYARTQCSSGRPRLHVPSESGLCHRHAKW